MTRRSCSQYQPWHDPNVCIYVVVKDEHFRGYGRHDEFSASELVVD